MAISAFSDKQKVSFRESNARINIFEGSVRSGKSFISLIRWLEFIRNGPKGPLVIIGRTDKTIKRNIIMPIQDLIGSALTYSAGKGEAVLYGRTMFLIGANDDRAEAKIRGSEFAGALIDELTLIPENFFKMLLSRMSVDGAQIFGTTNPDSPFHWLKRDFMDRRDELDMKVFSYVLDDNPSLSDAYKNSLKKEYMGLWYQRFIDGKWVMAEGAIFDFFDHSKHVIQEPPGPAKYYVVGVDYGTSNPTAFTMIGYNPSHYPNMWLEKEYYFDSRAMQRQKSDFEYAEDMKEFVAGFNVKAIYIDPSAASLKREFQRQGIESLRDAKNDVLPGIRYVSNLISSGEFKVCANCTNMLKELATYSWDSSAAKKGIDKPLKTSDHICFVKDTMIMTPDGEVPIQKLKVGDLLTTRKGPRRVEYRIVNQSKDIWKLIFKNKSLVGTGDHPIILSDNSKIKMKSMDGEYNTYFINEDTVDIKPELILFDVNKIEELEKEENPTLVYNISVEGEHEYFANGLLVSNCDALRYGLYSEFFKKSNKGMTASDARRLEDEHSFSYYN